MNRAAATASPNLDPACFARLDTPYRLRHERYAAPAITFSPPASAKCRQRSTGSMLGFRSIG